jgi:hypothetical protein
VTGEALKMRLEIAALMQKHHAGSQPFKPKALLPPVEGDIVIEGIASPATIDREFTKFSQRCWVQPFKQNIPLLYRHGRSAGEVEEVRITDQGLYVRARVTDAEAKCCPYFSIAATIHHYELRNVDDPVNFHALVGCATLNEVSLVTDNPGNAVAIITERRQVCAAGEFYQLAARKVDVMRQMLELLPYLKRSQADEQHRHPANSESGVALSVAADSSERRHDAQRDAKVHLGRIQAERAAAARVGDADELESAGRGSEIAWLKP